MLLKAAPLQRAVERGISLIEVLVGIAVGMVGIVVIFQTVVVWDKHTQTTKGLGDAQMAGTVAMFDLERDLKLAGFGFGTAAPSVMGCTVQAHDADPSRAASAPLGSFPLSPVMIHPGVDGGPDTIDVLHGNSAFFVAAGEFINSGANTKQVKRRGGFHPGDVAVVAGNGSASAASADCQLIEITDASAPDGVTVTHAAAVSYTAFGAASGVTASARFNAAASATFSSGTIYNLGPQPQLNRWAVVNQTLTSADVIHGDAPLDVAENVVNLKAEYGYDADGDGQLTDADWTTTLPTVGLDWTKVLAIRVAILVRSRQYEKAGDTPSVAASGAASAPVWFKTHEFAMTNVDGSVDSGATAADPNNWRYYRYRVYERVIPMRNMIWGKLAS